MLGITAGRGCDCRRWGACDSKGMKLRHEEALRTGMWYYCKREVSP